MSRPVFILPVNRLALQVEIATLFLLILVFATYEELLILDAQRLAWVRSSTHGPVYSVGIVLAFIIIPWALYRLYWKSQFRNIWNMVVIDSYDDADYKLIPQEEYEQMSDYIPEDLQEEIIREHGMRCYWTGRRLHREKVGKGAQKFYSKIKDSNNFIAGLGRVLIKSYYNKLHIDHIIPKRLKGPTRKDNLVPAAAEHNSSKNKYLRGKHLRAAIYLAYSNGETIHRESLRRLS